MYVCTYIYIYIHIYIYIYICIRRSPADPMEVSLLGSVGLPEGSQSYINVIYIYIYIYVYMYN